MSEGIPPTTQTVTQDTIQRYAELSGDHNPLHVDPEFAAGTPFGGPIAHGPIALQTAFVAVARWLGGDALPPGVTFAVTYRAPVRPGDAISFEPTALDRETDPATLEGECRNQRGETVIGVSVTVPRAALS